MEPRKSSNLKLSIVLVGLMLWIFPINAMDSGENHPPSSPENRTIPRLASIVEKYMRNKKKFDMNIIYKNFDFKGNLPKRNRSCNIYTKDDKMHSKIRDLLAEGTKLMEFILHFPEYKVNPITSDDVKWNYKTNMWYRAYNSHGRTLLTLAFNYDILSMSILTFGVHRLDIGLTDTPSGCFGQMSETRKLQELLYLITMDFDEEEGVNMISDGEASSCHQFIKMNGGTGDFEFMCCQWDEETADVKCAANKPSEWTVLLMHLIRVVKVLALLFGPNMLLWVIHSQSIRREEYEVNLRETLGVDNATLYEDKTNPRFHRVRMLRNFKKHINNNTVDGINGQRFDKVNILVDHRKLMCETVVPVGLMNFLFENLLLCKLTKWKTFVSCCSASLCGSWSSKFLCLTLSNKNKGKGKDGAACTWASLVSSIGGILIIVLLPLPYYFRLFLFYQYEHDEIHQRLDALAKVSLQPVHDHHPLHYLTPTHALFIVIYVVYAICMVILCVCTKLSTTKFSEVVIDAVQDMRQISKIECARLYISHLLLPLEKFGVLGVLVGILYWPFAFTACLITTACYCIPSLYLTGRFLMDKRPSFFKHFPAKSSYCSSYRQQKVYNLSEGTKSLEESLLLNNISKRDDSTCTRRTLHLKHFKKVRSDTLKICSIEWIIAIAAVLLMWAVLVMFSEITGFLVEVFVFSLMGTIVNASHAAQYIMLAFWIIMYSSNCFNFHYEKYLKLSAKVFEFIKSKKFEDDRKLSDVVSNLISLSSHVQGNNAFKYYTNKEINEHIKREIEEFDKREDSTIEDSTNTNSPSLDMEVTDTITNCKGKLTWKAHSLVFFIDAKDSPRIPKKLFKSICDIEAPGCPGPIHLSLMKAGLQLFHMVLFLLFVLVVIMIFGDVYKVSTTNQLLMTLAGGFLPFIIRTVLTPRKDDLNLSTYTFNGRIQEKIRKYNQVWPVFDISLSEHGLGGGQKTPGSTPSTAPVKRSRNSMGDQRTLDDVALSMGIVASTAMDTSPSTIYHTPPRGSPNISSYNNSLITDMIDGDEDYDV